MKYSCTSHWGINPKIVFNKVIKIHIASFIWSAKQTKMEDNLEKERGTQSEIQCTPNAYSFSFLLLYLFLFIFYLFY